MEIQVVSSQTVDRVPVPTTTGSHKGVRLFGLGVLVSAFLLFQLELIVAKHILPWFGGSPSVWTTCMLFFQGVLLAGYAFAHWSSTRLSLRAQGKLQLAVIAIAMAFFVLALLAWESPLTPSGYMRGVFRGHPVLQILLVLALGVGAPFFLLSTTAPVMQYWFRIRRADESSYRLYALSNIGSLFGLMSYPYLLEWMLTLRHQAWLWNILFAAFAGLYVVICRAVVSHAATESGQPLHDSQRPSLGMRMVWASLAACGSAMLLATTNLLCEDVAVTPFLWVLPLCLYLLSFILCFDHPRWYKRWLFYPLYAVAIWAALWIFHGGISLDLIQRADAYLFVLFVICMICHGELARSKPTPSQLTSFYLMVSLGGALGGVAVSLVAPRVFSGYWEFHICLIGCGVLALCALLVGRSSLLYQGVGWKLPVISLLLVIVGVGIYRAARQQTAGRLFMRDFFGVKQIYEKDGMRYLLNGGVIHGMQYLDPAHRNEALTYYSRYAALGKLLMNYPPLQGRGRRIGIVGLGTGVMAAYGQPRDTLRFWEIDPQVIALAQGPNAKFTFLKDTKASVEVIEEDGRLALEGETQQPGYDILIVDAFSGDAIPIQLVTREAFRLYLSRMNGPDSVLVFHISTRMVDLTPVMLAFSRAERVPLRLYINRTAEYAMFARNPAVMDVAGQDEKDYPWDQVESVLWTDGYSSLLSVVRH
jgi:hypothetical protein